MGGSTRKTVVVVLVACSLAGAMALPGAGAPSGSFAMGQFDADSVLLQIDLTEDGYAHWTVEYRFRLDDENATAAFESLEAEIQSAPENFTERFEERMDETAKATATATGREMTIHDVDVRTEQRLLPQEYGVVAYTFEWRNFAAVDGDTIRAGDALGGLFLDEETRLVVSWPNEYDLQEVAPQPDETRERSVIWHGPTDFGSEEPRIVVSQVGVLGTLPLAVIGGAAAVALVVVAILGLWWVRHPTNRSSDAPADQSSDVPVEASAGDDPPEPPDDLLSNEEQVLRLLERNGGRMKQQEVVQQLGWTDAKTSQVVGGLREAGDVEGFRLGRENVLRLPEDDA